MRKALLSGILLTTLVGCGILPSKWDDNESWAVINLYTDISLIDCYGQPHEIKSDVRQVRHSLDWFRHYTTYNNTADIDELLDIMDETVSGIEVRDSWSITYCKLKQDNLLSQAKSVSKAVMGRSK